VDHPVPWPKRGLRLPVRTADEPGQTLNADLCFVPATQEVPTPLPAVSGSSGRLLVAPPPADRAPAHPGQVFADPDRPYTEAMQAFVSASLPHRALPAPFAAALPPDPATLQRALRQGADRLRVERRAVRQQRQAEDALWRHLWHQQHPTIPPHPTPAPPLPPLPPEAWRTIRQHRQKTLRQRAAEDEAWRAARQHIRQQLTPATAHRDWIAILVLTDNCTRVCYGLPLFTTGATVTAEQVVDALRQLLPPDLQFLITDRGTHFTATALAQLASAADFVHVLIARHRPQSNGIAERLVQTLKDWLADQTWTSADEVASLLAAFLVEYNNRPHRGLGLPGLSPNEFANRIWVL
jgi:transposase InsO family protein